MRLFPGVFPRLGKPFPCPARRLSHSSHHAIKGNHQYLFRSKPAFLSGLDQGNHCVGITLVSWIDDDLRN